jgi:hypothetical protein
MCNSKAHFFMVWGKAGDSHLLLDLLTFEMRNHGWWWRGRGSCAALIELCLRLKSCHTCILLSLERSEASREHVAAR